MSIECLTHLAFNETRKRGHGTRLGVAAVAGRLYAIGGFDGRQFLRSVEAFDPRSNRWTEVRGRRATALRVGQVLTSKNIHQNRLLREIDNPKHPLESALAVNLRQP